MGLTSVGQDFCFNGVLNLLGIKEIYLQVHNFSFDDMSKIYILWITHTVMHIESDYLRSFNVAEELFGHSFPMPSKVTPNAGLTLNSNLFPFNLYQILCHTIWIWKIS